MVNAERLHYNPKAKPYAVKQSSSKIYKLIRFVTVLGILSVSLSYLIYGNFVFNYTVPSWRKLKGTYLTKETIFTPDTLKKFDGSDSSLPIYLGFMGEVYDVTAGRSHYGPGGGYAFFAGKDAARAFITGCFETHLTHDIRGLTKQQIKDIKDWQDFYANHAEYFRVGKIINPPIDPNSPIPPPCVDDNGAPINSSQGSVPANKVGKKPISS